MKAFIFRTLFLVLFSVIIVTPVLIYLFFLRGETILPVDPLPQQVERAVSEPPNDQDSPQEVALTTGLEISPIIVKSSRKETKHKPKEVLSAAEKMSRRISRSLVYIVSPLGQATGFFIDGKGHILTVKYVVGYTVAELEKIRKEKNLQDQIVVLEQQRLRTIRQKMSLLSAGPEKEEFQHLSDEKKKELIVSLSRSRDLDNLLKDGEGSSLDTLKDIHVFSPNGRALELRKVTLGSTSDMALLQVNAAGLEHAPLRPRTIPLRAGDRVFAAGYVEQSNLLVQQGKVVDPPLPLGVCSDIQIQGSGGPLLDRYGNVSGLNSGRSKNDNGNDCAIPILTAYDEFSSFLIPQIRAVKSKIYVSNTKGSGRKPGFEAED